MTSVKNINVCRIPLINLRREPSHTSELINQMCYGEIYGIITEQKDWSLVQSGVDGYEGWCRIRRHEKISSEKFNLFPVTKSPITKIELAGGIKINVPAGSFLAGIQAAKDSLTESKANSFDTELAMQFYGSPYLWGGKSVMGIDCSGLTQIVMRRHGVFIKLDAAQQVNEGTTVDFINEAMPGDLAYFGNEEGNIVHTGIIIGDGKILHSSGSVRIDRIDQNGIYCEEEKTYTHFLRTIRRVL